MTAFLAVSASVALAIAMFFTPSLRRWWERRSSDARDEAQFIDDYREAARDLLRATDPEKHADIREAIIFLGECMMDPALVRSLIAFWRRVRKNGHPPRRALARSFDDLSEDAKHALSRAIANALIVSSYQSLFLGGMYRHLLMLAIDQQRNEVLQPVQVIHRIVPANDADCRKVGVVAA